LTPKRWPRRSFPTGCFCTPKKGRVSLRQARLGSCFKTYAPHYKTKNADPQKRIGVGFIHGPLLALASLGLRLLRVLTGYGWDIPDGCLEGKRGTRCFFWTGRRQGLGIVTGHSVAPGSRASTSFWPRLTVSLSASPSFPIPYPPGRCQLLREVNVVKDVPHSRVCSRPLTAAG
jgi:hypothetical protein